VIGVTIRSIDEALSWADIVDNGLAVVLLKGAEGATAARSAVGALMAHEAIAEGVCTVRATEENIRVQGQRIVIKHFSKLVNAILNLVHVFDSGLNRWEAHGNR